MDPIVSIGMSVFNCESTLGQAIRSILQQTYDNWELILIDDGSQDKTVAVANSYQDRRIRIIVDGKNKRLAARLNQAVRESRGKYFARMDADDIAYPSRLKAQVQFLEDHPGIELVGSRVMIFSGKGRIIGTYPFKKNHAEICSRPWAGFYLPHPTWMGNTVWFRQNPYNISTPKAQDQELLLRTYEHSRFACLPEILLGYRKSKLSLRTLLTGRYYYSRMLIQKAVNEKQYFFAFGVLEQMVKFMVETFAITTGLNYRVLQHRAVSVSRRESEIWEKVWKACR
jgi:glycosyltransferase involved in cell wall biosynthesis